jgi:hypothetical protein
MRANLSNGYSISNQLGFQLELQDDRNVVAYDYDWS